MFGPECRSGILNLHNCELRVTCVTRFGYSGSLRTSYFIVESDEAGAGTLESARTSLG
jgi:hypothetical protein